MANGAPIPVTFAGGLSTNTYKGQLWIDKKLYTPPSHSGNVFWYVVVSLTNLTDVPVNIVSKDNSTVPPEVAHYAGRYDYMLCFCSLNGGVPYVPQGELYNFLELIGAADFLQRLEQVASQTGSALAQNYAYNFADALTQGDNKAIEALSFAHTPVMTLQLLPITVDGKTVYTPVKVGSTQL